MPWTQSSMANSIIPRGDLYQEGIPGLPMEWEEFADSSSEGRIYIWNPGTSWWDLIYQDAYWWPDYYDLDGNYHVGRTETSPLCPIAQATGTFNYCRYGYDASGPTAACLIGAKSDGSNDVLHFAYLFGAKRGSIRRVLYGSSPGVSGFVWLRSNGLAWLPSSEFDAFGPGGDHQIHTGLPVIAEIPDLFKSADACAVGWTVIGNRYYYLYQDTTSGFIVLTLNYIDIPSGVAYYGTPITFGDGQTPAPGIGGFQGLSFFKMRGTRQVFVTSYRSGTSGAVYTIDEDLRVAWATYGGPQYYGPLIRRNYPASYPAMGANCWVAEPDWNTTTKKTGDQQSILFPPAAPVVTSVSPAAGPMNASRFLTLTGTNLDGLYHALINGFPCANEAPLPYDGGGVLGTKGTIQVPESTLSGTVALQVSADGADNVSTGAYTYEACSITSFAPTGGPVGTKIVFTGTGFVDINLVQIGGFNAAYTVDSYNQITVTLPAGPPVNVKASIWIRSATMGDAFRLAANGVLYTVFVPPPPTATYSQVVPNIVQAGYVVPGIQIAGSGFLSVTPDKLTFSAPGGVVTLTSGQFTVANNTTINVTTSPTFPVEGTFTLQASRAGIAAGSLSGALVAYVGGVSFTIGIHFVIVNNPLRGIQIKLTNVPSTQINRVQFSGPTVLNIDAFQRPDLKTIIIDNFAFGLSGSYDLSLWATTGGSGQIGDTLVGAIVARNAALPGQGMVITGMSIAHLEPGETGVGAKIVGRYFTGDQVDQVKLISGAASISFTVQPYPWVLNDPVPAGMFRLEDDSTLKLGDFVLNTPGLYGVEFDKLISGVMRYLISKISLLEVKDTLPPALEFDPPPGAYAAPVALTIRAHKTNKAGRILPDLDPTAKIYFTTDGRRPVMNFTQEWPPKGAGGAPLPDLAVNRSTTVFAFAKDQYNNTSEPVAVFYEIVAFLADRLPFGFENLDLNYIQLRLTNILIDNVRKLVKAHFNVSDIPGVTKVAPGYSASPACLLRDLRRAMEAVLHETGQSIAQVLSVPIIQPDSSLALKVTMGREIFAAVPQADRTGTVLASDTLSLPGALQMSFTGLDTTDVLAGDQLAFRDTSGITRVFHVTGVVSLTTVTVQSYNPDGLGTVVAGVKTLIHIFLPYNPNTPFPSNPGDISFHVSRRGEDKLTLVAPVDGTYGVYVAPSLLGLSYLDVLVTLESSPPSRYTMHQLGGFTVTGGAIVTSSIYNIDEGGGISRPVASHWTDDSISSSTYMEPRDIHWRELDIAAQNAVMPAGWTQTDEDHGIHVGDPPVLPDQGDDPARPREYLKPSDPATPPSTDVIPSLAARIGKIGGGVGGADLTTSICVAGSGIDNVPVSVKASWTGATQNCWVASGTRYTLYLATGLVAEGPNVGPQCGAEVAPFEAGVDTYGNTYNFGVGMAQGVAFEKTGWSPTISFPAPVSPWPPRIELGETDPARLTSRFNHPILGGLSVTAPAGHAGFPGTVSGANPWNGGAYGVRQARYPLGTPNTIPSCPEFWDMTAAAVQDLSLARAGENLSNGALFGPTLPPTTVKGRKPDGSQVDVPTNLNNATITITFSPSGAPVQTVTPTIAGDGQSLSFELPAAVGGGSRLSDGYFTVEWGAVMGAIPGVHFYRYDTWNAFSLGSLTITIRWNYTYQLQGPATRGPDAVTLVYRGGWPPIAYVCYDPGYGYPAKVTPFDVSGNWWLTQFPTDALPTSTTRNWTIAMIDAYAGRHGYVGNDKTDVVPQGDPNFPTYGRPALVNMTSSGPGDRIQIEITPSPNLVGSLTGVQIDVYINGVWALTAAQDTYTPGSPPTIRKVSASFTSPDYTTVEVVAIPIGANGTHVAMTSAFTTGGGVPTPGSDVTGLEIKQGEVPKYSVFYDQISKAGVPIRQYTLKTAVLAKNVVDTSNQFLVYFDIVFPDPEDAFTALTPTAIVNGVRLVVPQTGFITDTTSDPPFVIRRGTYSGSYFASDPEWIEAIVTFEGPQAGPPAQARFRLASTLAPLPAPPTFPSYDAPPPAWDGDEYVQKSLAILPLQRAITFRAGVGTSRIFHAKISTADVAEAQNVIQADITLEFKVGNTLVGLEVLVRLGTDTSPIEKYPTYIGIEGAPVYLIPAADLDTIQIMIVPKGTAGSQAILREMHYLEGTSFPDWPEMHDLVTYDANGVLTYDTKITDIKGLFDVDTKCSIIDAQYAKDFRLLTGSVPMKFKAEATSSVNVNNQIRREFHLTLQSPTIVNDITFWYINSRYPDLILPIIGGAWPLGHEDENNPIVPQPPNYGITGSGTYVDPFIMQVDKPEQLQIFAKPIFPTGQGMAYVQTGFAYDTSTVTTTLYPSTPNGWGRAFIPGNMALVFPNPVPPEQTLHNRPLKGEEIVVASGGVAYDPLVPGSGVSTPIQFHAKATAQNASDNVIERTIWVVVRDPIVSYP